MKLFGYDHSNNFDFGSEKNLLAREADEAFHADDRLSCIESVERLYSLLDDALENSGHWRHPGLTA